MLDFLSIDRDVCEAAMALDVHALTRQADAPSIRRRVSTLEAARELEPLTNDALAAALHRWVRHLTVLRATAPDHEAMCASFRARADETSTRTVDDHVGGLFAGAADRATAVRVLEDNHARVMDPSLRWYERTCEARRRAGVVTLDARGLAKELIDKLRALDEEPRAWPDVIERGLSRARGEGWPAHLSPRTLTELLGRGFFEGLTLPALRLPQPLGVSSFARALRDLGRAVALLDRDSTRPFVLSRSPVDGLVHRRAALFGALVLSRTFHRRRFGLAPHVATDEVRAVARSSIVWLKVAALRVLMGDGLLSDQRANTFEELTDHIFGRPWPGRLATVVPRLDASASEQLVGLLRAERDRVALRDRFDEDWFDNPKAVVWIRHEHHQSTIDRIEPPPDPREVLGLVDHLREILDG